MSSQKWNSPAGLPTLTTVTVSGADVDLTSISQTFASAGEINVGSVIRITAYGTVTTTGTPTLTINASGASIGGVTSTASLPTGVTDQPWRLVYEVIVRASDGSGAAFLRVDGLYATDVRIASASGTGTITGTWSVEFDLLSGGNADAGDVITIQGCFAEWIG